MSRGKLLRIKASITICGERKQVELKDKTCMFCASSCTAACTETLRKRDFKLYLNRPPRIESTTACDILGNQITDSGRQCCLISDPCWPSCHLSLVFQINSIQQKTDPEVVTYRTSQICFCFFGLLIVAFKRVKVQSSVFCAT